jgi:hypothetical protein
MRRTALKVTAPFYSLAWIGSMEVGFRRVPCIEVAGSYFPGWLIAFAGGLILTALARSIFSRAKLLHLLGHPAVIYPSMTLLFTCLIWLCFFN